ncbi:MAG: hypothetical protein GF401_02025 [Chitinivibrionales bacterium]|nr:hypothetical protein [Chitinivibrionales bacterium]
MIIHEDLKELLRLLNERSVEYVIVGGYAVAFYGFIRATKDIDILCGSYADIQVYFISKADLFKSKRFAGRPQDIRDIEELGGASA